MVLLECTESVGLSVEDDIRGRGFADVCVHYITFPADKLMSSRSSGPTALFNCLIKTLASLRIHSHK